MALHKEFYEACNLHDWLELRGIPHTHVANEGQGNAARGALNKRMGVSAGFPDFLIFLPNHINVAVELKADKTKKPTKSQLAWLEVLKGQGFETAVCHGFYEAVDYIEYLMKTKAVGRPLVGVKAANSLKRGN